MKYPGLFKNKYSLRGKDWLRRIPEEDRKVFSDIGSQNSNRGKLGGDALVKKKGKKYMKQIAKNGAFVTNMKVWFRKAIEQEQEKLKGDEL